MASDRRTTYTRRVIREAFLELIQCKPIQKIAVSDVCRRADISRPTFYLHYANLQDLLDDIGQSLIAQARLDEMTSLRPADGDAIHRAILHLLQIVLDNLEIYRICILEGGLQNQITHNITDALQQTIIANWVQEGRLDPQLDRQYLSDYIQASFHALVRCWLRKPQPREDTDDLAWMIERFLCNGLSGFLQLPAHATPDVHTTATEKH